MNLRMLANGLVILVVTLALAGRTPAAEPAMLTVPIRVHLITGTELKDNGKAIDLWLNEAEFKKSVLPEMNRIWKPAGVTWAIESVVVEAAVHGPDFAKTMAEIAKGGTVEMKTLATLFPKQSRDANHINLYILPRIGGENGVAGLGGKTAVVSIWRRGGGMLQRAPAVTTQAGLVSVAKTCAHELGHTLGLKHPDPPVKARLMTAGPGLELSPDEIETARKRATELAK